MKIQTLLYNSDSGWSLQSFPVLDSVRTLILAFGETALLDNPAPLIELRKAYPKSIFLGCSTSGGILGTSIHDSGLQVAVVQFEKTEIKEALASIKGPEESHEAGKVLAQQLKGPGLKGVFLLSDGLHVNGTDLIRGVNSVLGPEVIVTGGLAGDAERFSRTWALKGASPTQRVISAVGFYGDSVRIGHGSRGGWDLFGPERKVTRSTGNVLYELDGKPALKLYKEYLGERAKGLPATALLFPLTIKFEDEKNSRSLVRTVLSVDEAAQSLTFAGDIPQGKYVQMMKANFDRLIDGAAGAASVVNFSETSDAFLAIAISCVGRRLVLRERTEEELEATLEGLPRGSQQIGFYSYGEISPYVSGEACDLHNQTMTLTVISEE